MTEVRDANAYAAPKLTVYGKVADLTTNGKSTGKEGTGQGNRNRKP